VKEHRYEATVRWTGAREGTTSAFGAYSREHEAVVEGKPVLRLSAGGTFLGDDALHNAEDLLVIALSGAHVGGVDEQSVVTSLCRRKPPGHGSTLPDSRCGARVGLAAQKTRLRYAGHQASEPTAGTIRRLAMRSLPWR
jgi:hypothetical protein